MSNNNNNDQNAIRKYNFCTSKLKTTTEKFVWTIENFSKRQKKCGECLRSTEFISTAISGQTLKWQMEMFPNGKDEECEGYVSLSLVLITDSNHRDVKADTNYEISIIDANREEVVISPIADECHEFTADMPEWRDDQLISREALLDGENDYLDGDRLTIVCKLIVHEEMVENAPLVDVEVPECRGMEDVSYLFEQSLFPDCKIISADDKVFKAHKCILICRSPVFAAMFEHEMIERNSNIIDIEDMNGNVIEAMLRFIYSGNEPDLEEGMCEDLLKAAEKYQLPRLKLICERKLINSLGNANACELLLLANLHLAENLKSNAIHFIKMHLNEVKGSVGWKDVLADEQLVEKILMEN